MNNSFTLFGLTFHFYNQWPGILRPSQHNWSDFTLIKIQGEYNSYAYSEFVVGLLGFVLVIARYYNVFNDRLEKAFNDFDSSSEDSQTEEE